MIRRPLDWLDVPAPFLALGFVAVFGVVLAAIAVGGLLAWTLAGLAAGLLLVFGDLFEEDRR